MDEEPVPGGDRPPTDVDGADAFVGRVAELRRLDETYRQADRAGGHAVLVTGVRGVGKTTLVEAFLDRLAGQREPPLVGTGRCVAGVTPPYHAFRQVFDDLPAGPGEVFDDTDGLPVDDVDGARQRRRGMFADVGDRLHTLAADRPLVLVFEDLHSADPATLFLLEYLVEAVTGWTSPVLVLVTARVGVTDRVEELAEAGDPARTVEVGLDSLDRDDVRGLLEHLLDVEQVSQTALDRVYDHTGGNPLFVREVSRTLAAHSDTGPLPEDTLTDWGVDHVSATVERAVTDRIEACSAPDRALLELGAVLGETVSLPVLVAASERPAAAVRESVDRLLDRRLWERTDDAVTFVHGVVRDQLRDQLDGERRVASHRRAAEAIETVHTDTPDRQYGRLGEHYEAADRPRQAIRWYRQAGERALGVYGHEAAVESYQRALELARTHDVLDSEELAAVYAEVANALWTTGSPGTAAEHASEGLVAAPERSRVRCRLFDIRANAESNRGEYDTAERLSRSQRELAADLPAPVFEAKAHRRLGALARRHSEYDRAREQYRVALDIARETENRVLESRVLLGIGGIAYHQSRFETAHEYATRSRAIVQELGDRRQETRVLNFLGAVASSRDEYDRARSYYRRCLDIDGRFGDRHRQARVLNNLGLAARQEGDYDEARRHYEQSLDIARELDDDVGMAYSRHNLGEVAVYRGDSDRAREQLRHSLETVREHGDGRVEVANLVRLGDCERVARSFDRAVER